MPPAPEVIPKILHVFYWLGRACAVGKSVPVLSPLDIFVPFGVRLFRLRWRRAILRCQRYIIGCVDVIVVNDVMRGFRGAVLGGVVFV